jgi:hypothetical protein
VIAYIHYKSPNIVYRANNVLVDAQLSTQYFKDTPQLVDRLSLLRRQTFGTNSLHCSVILNPSRPTSHSWRQPAEITALENTQWWVIWALKNNNFDWLIDMGTNSLCKSFDHVDRTGLWLGVITWSALDTELYKNSTVLLLLWNIEQTNQPFWDSTKRTVRGQDRYLINYCPYSRAEQNLTGKCICASIRTCPGIGKLSYLNWNHLYDTHPVLANSVFSAK